MPSALPSRAPRRISLLTSCRPLVLFLLLLLFSFSVAFSFFSSSFSFSSYISLFLEASISPPFITPPPLAHCADLYPPIASDPAELTKTRASVVSYLTKWLNSNEN